MTEDEREWKKDGWWMAETGNLNVGGTPTLLE
jgi:hypothetical protein